MKKKDIPNPENRRCDSCGIELTMENFGGVHKRAPGTELHYCTNCWDRETGES